MIKVKDCVSKNLEDSLKLPVYFQLINFKIKETRDYRKIVNYVLNIRNNFKQNLNNWIKLV